MADARVPEVRIDGLTLPPLNVVLPITVTIGRSDPTSQPDANALSFTWWGDILPSNIRRGAPVNVSLTSANPDIWDDIWTDEWVGDPDSGPGSQRFNGRVADITASPDPVGGKVWAEVLCIGTLTDLADQVIGDEPWPVETDRERIERMLPHIEFSWPLINDGSTALRLRGRDVDRRKALELLHLFAGSVGSIVWEYPDGSVRYQSFDHRSTTWSAGYIYLPSRAIISEAQWAQSADQLIDRVRVEYGADPEGGERPEVVAGDGLHETRFSGELADQGGAAAVAAVILDRWGRTDLWDAPQVATRSDLLDDVTYDSLITMLPSESVVTENLTTYPTPGNTGEGGWFVEGWEETWEREGNGAPLVHGFQLAVSDVRRFLVAGRTSDLVLTVVLHDAVYFTATVVRADGEPFDNYGVMTLTSDGRQILPPIDMTWLDPAPTEVVWSDWATNLNLPGVHEFRANYSGYPTIALPGVSNVVAFVSPVPPNGSWNHLTVSPTLRPRVGDILQLTATLYDPADGVPDTPGVQNFSIYDYATGVWSLLAAVEVGEGETAVTMEWRVPNNRIVALSSYYMPDTQIQVQSTPPVYVTPVAVVNRVEQHPALWTSTYDRDGNQLPNVPDLRQGDWDDGTGDNLGMIGFNLDPTDWANHYVTRVEVFLHVLDWEQGQSGTLRIGSHPFSGAGAPPRGHVTHRTDISGWGQGTGRWTDITSWGKALVSPGGAVRGVGVGPAGNVSTPGIVAGVGDGVVAWDALGDLDWDSVPPDLLWVAGDMPEAGDDLQWDQANPFLTWDTIQPPELIWDSGKHPPLLRITGYRWDTAGTPPFVVATALVNPQVEGPSHAV